MNSQPALVSGIPVRLSVPQAHGNRRTLDGVLSNVELPRVEILFATPTTGIDLEVRDTPWFMTHELADCVIAHQISLLDASRPQQWQLEIFSSTCHRTTRRSERIEAQVTIRNLPELPLGEIPANDSEQTITLNSEGLSFSTSRQLRVDQLLDLDLQFPGDRPGRIRVTGKVLRITARPEGRHLVALGFTRISRANRENLRRLFITRHFHDLNARVRVLGSLFSPTLDR